MSDWKAQVQASESAYEHFFPELSDRYDSSPTKTEYTSPYYVFLTRCGIPDMDLGQFKPSGDNPIDRNRLVNMSIAKYCFR